MRLRWRTATSRKAFFQRLPQAPDCLLLSTSAPASSSAGHQLPVSARCRERRWITAQAHSANSSMSRSVRSELGSAPRLLTMSPQPRRTIARRRLNQLSYSVSGSLQSVWSCRRSPLSTQATSACSSSFIGRRPRSSANVARSVCSGIQAECRGICMQTSGENSLAASAGNSGQGEVTTADGSTRNMTTSCSDRCRRTVGVTRQHVEFSAAIGAGVWHEGPCGCTFNANNKPYRQERTCPLSM